jgi:hypothetical protein
LENECNERETTESEAEEEEEVERDDCSWLSHDL